MKRFKIQESLCQFLFPDISDDNLLKKEEAEELVDWYKEYIDTHWEPPDVSDLIAKYRKIKESQIRKSMEESDDIDEIMYHAHSSFYDIESFDDMIEMEVRALVFGDVSIVNDLISEAYNDLNLSFLFDENSVGLIDEIDNSSQYPNKKDTMIIGAQVPLFRILRSTRRASLIKYINFD